MTKLYHNTFTCLTDERKGYQHMLSDTDQRGEKDIMLDISRMKR